MKHKMYNIGVEREGLRCIEDGTISTLHHPKIFGEKNNFITTDFAETQMELRTPKCENTTECYEKLKNITDVVLNELQKRNEFLWPYSMPCILPKDNNYIFVKTEEKRERKLLEKYGGKMLCISGIHVNFSIDKQFFKEIKKIIKNVPLNIDEAYIKIMKEITKKAWMLIYLLGSTPMQNGKNSFRCKCSLRNTYKEGFRNNKLIDINFENKEKYIKSIEENIEKGYIASAREAYIPIRAKSPDKDNIQWLKEHEIDHIEIRICDLNPFDRCGISKAELDFIIAFIFNSLINEDEYTTDYRIVAEQGITTEQKEKIAQEFKKIIKTNEKLKLGCEEGIKEIYNQYQKGITNATKIEKIINEKGYIKGIIELANKYKNEAIENKYAIESNGRKILGATAAIIKDAISQGIDYKIINPREYDCFVEFTNGKKKQYVIGGTRTDKDVFILPYITDDKYFAKQLIKENNIKVPEGIMISKDMTVQEQEKNYSKFYNRKVVIKPRTTNGGAGITVFSQNATPKQLEKAISYAFEFDNNILLEEHIQGQEYRFIVINGKCVSVVLRRSASVVGNGKNTIQELIDIKNKEPWHYLIRHKIRIDTPVKMHLKQQNLTLESIPKKDERIYLRENSNCSTGGESVNFTEEMPIRFKKIAEKAARIFGAKVCGVDIMIDDLSKKEYSIIEINDDPGYSINQWPYEGEEAKIGLEILKMLKLIK